MKSRFLFLLAGIFCISAVQSQNILSNPSFDVNTTGWTPTVTAPSSATFNPITTDTLWGAGSLSANVTTYSGTATSIRYASTAATTTASTNYVISFWAKSSVDNNKLDIEADFNSGTDVKRQMNMTTQWRYYEYNVTTPAGSSSMAINFYLKGTGSFSIDECRIITEANWFNDANYRINIARKGNFTIRVRRPDNTAYVDSVFITHKMHEYRFGTAMALNTTVLNPANYKWYHDTMAVYFNTGVPENDTKWHRNEPFESTYNYLKADSMVAWSDSVGWHEIRGHAFLWGGCRNFHLAPWQAPELTLNANDCSTPGPGAALSSSKWFQITRDRVLRDGARWIGKINEWDVLNEGGHETYVRGRAGFGDSIYWQVFRWAKQANPNMKTAINDYSTVESNAYGGYNNGYESLINTIDAKMAATGSGKIDIVGVQAHFFGGDLSGGLIQFNAMRKNMERYTAMGKEIKFTEFDVAGTNQAQHASNTANTMRFSYSHPGMTGLYWWGFWDGKHWRAAEQAGMWNAAKARKPSGDSLAYLLKNEWATKDSGLLNASGERTFRGHYAKYTIRIKRPNGTYKFIDTTLFQTYNNQVVTITLTNADMITGPLPVREIVLNATKTNTHVAVKWETKNEEQVNRYEVERANNGRDWKKLGNASAYNQLLNSYEWLDKDPVNGKNFYRIKIINEDGSYSYSDTKLVAFSDEEKQMTVIPNPAVNTTALQLPVSWAGADVRVEVVNANGMLMMSRNIAGTQPSINLTVSNLSPGLYHVTVTNKKTGTTKKSRMVIAR